MTHRALHNGVRRNPTEALMFLDYSGGVEELDKSLATFPLTAPGPMMSLESPL